MSKIIDLSNMTKVSGDDLPTLKAQLVIKSDRLMYLMFSNFGDSGFPVDNDENIKICKNEITLIKSKIEQIEIENSSKNTSVI